MTEWVTDSNGNRASVEYWGSKEAAEASLKTLRNCRDCTNCSYCSGCSGCSRCSGCWYCSYCSGCSYCSYCSGCSGCSGCSRCSYCSYCSYCSGCDLSKPNYRMPVSDPRGYTWLAIAENGAWRIRAGCRSYSIEEAREHWLADDYYGPDSVKETVGFALDWIEAKEI